MDSSPRKTLGAMLGLAIAVTAVVGTLPSLLPFSRVPENWLADLRLAGFAPVPPVPGDVVVVAVTEETLAAFPYRSPLDRGFLVEILRALESAGARAVGVDVLFDQPTEKPKDDALRETLRGYSLPLVVASADEASGLTAAQARFLAGFLDGVPTGHAELITDSADGTVRWFEPGEPAGFAAALAAAAGGTVPAAAQRIDYLRPAPDQEHVFATYPAHTVAFLPGDWFRDRVVLIGAELPASDRHRTPFAALEGTRGGSDSGVMIHAQILAQMLDGRLLRLPGPLASAALLLAAALLGAASAFADFRLLLRAAAMTGVLIVFWVGAFALYAADGPLLPLLMPSLAFALSAAAATAYVGRHDRAAREYIRSAFARYVSPNVVDQLVSRPETLKLGGERREVTYLFTDLASFTSLTERVDPEIMVRILNEYLAGMCRIVMDAGGTVDKIVGDAVAAFFGAPLVQPDHPQRAVECALALDAFCEDFTSRGLAKEHGVGITRIGVNTGWALIGNFGGDAFFDYTGHGDMVNTAARLESLNKHLGTRVCVSEATAQRCTGIRFRPVGAVVVKGKAEALAVSEPALEDAIPRPRFDAYMGAYGLLDGSPDAARTAFAAIVDAAPEDGLAAFHLARLSRGETGSTIVMTEK